MKLDNLFIVESPLQALVALELSEGFRGQSNGIIYRVCGKLRERSDDQIRKVVEMGDWCFKKELVFSQSGRVLEHLNVRGFIANIRSSLHENVDRIFFGEFRSHWMHVLRMALSPSACILMDDGAVTLSIKRDFIDNNIYYPDDLLYATRGAVKSIIKKILLKNIYRGLYRKQFESSQVLVASAFLSASADYKVDFSFIKSKFISSCEGHESRQKESLFFGSKYSEAGIVSYDYEIFFLKRVAEFNRKFGFNTVYCAHRDESSDKLMHIGSISHVEVIVPDVPAELFVLGRHKSVSEISAAYSSAINNLFLIFPEKKFRVFRLASKEINAKHREQVEKIYQYYVESGIEVVDFD